MLPPSLVLRFKEKTHYPYFFLHRDLDSEAKIDNRLVLQVPVLEGDSVGRDNTCYAFTALNIFFATSGSHNGTTALQSINMYIQDLEDDIRLLTPYRNASPDCMTALQEKNSRLQQLRQYKHLILKIAPTTRILGLRDQYPDSILRLMHAENSNGVSIQLAPMARDPFVKFPKPIFSLRRQEEATLDNPAPPIPEGLAVSLRASIKSVLDSGQHPGKSTIREAVLNAAVNQFQDRKFDNLEEAINEFRQYLCAQLKIHGIDRSLTETYGGESINSEYFEEILGFSGEIKNREVLENILNIAFRETDWAFYESIFSNVKPSSFNGDKHLQADRLSLIIQFFLGKLNLHCRKMGFSDINFGTVLDDDPHKIQFSECINQALRENHSIEIAILSYMDENFNAFGLNRAIPDSSKRKILTAFHSEFGLILGGATDTTHFDEYFFLDGEGVFKSHAEKICIPFSEFVDGNPSLSDADRAASEAFLLAEKAAMSLHPESKLHHKNLVGVECLRVSTEIDEVVDSLSIDISGAQAELFYEEAMKQQPDCLKGLNNYGEKPEKLSKALQIVFGPEFNLKHANGKYRVFVDAQNKSIVENKINELVFNKSGLIDFEVDAELLITLNFAFRSQYEGTDLYSTVNAIPDRRQRIEELLDLLGLPCYQVTKDDRSEKIRIRVSEKTRNSIEIFQQQRKDFEAENRALPIEIHLKPENASALYIAAGKFDALAMDESSDLKGTAKVMKALELLGVSYNYIRNNETSGYILNLHEASRRRIEEIFKKYAAEARVSNYTPRRRGDVSTEELFAAPAALPEISEIKQEFYISPPFIKRIYMAVINLYGKESEEYKAMSRMGSRHKVKEGLRLLGFKNSADLSLADRSMYPWMHDFAVMDIPLNASIPDEAILNLISRSSSNAPVFIRKDMEVYLYGSFIDPTTYEQGPWKTTKLDDGIKIPTGNQEESKLLTGTHMPNGYEVRICKGSVVNADPHAENNDDAKRLCGNILKHKAHTPEVAGYTLQASANGMQRIENFTNALAVDPAPNRPTDAEIATIGTLLRPVMQPLSPEAHSITAKLLEATPLPIQKNDNDTVAIFAPEWVQPLLQKLGSALEGTVLILPNGDMEHLGPGMTLRQLEIAARNESVNTTGQIDQREEGLNKNIPQDILLALRDLVRQCAMTGVLESNAYGGYNCQRVETLKKPVVICDIAGLQFQKKHNTGRLVLIEKDSSKGLLDDDIFTAITGERRKTHKELTYALGVDYDLSDLSDSSEALQGEKLEVLKNRYAKFGDNYFDTVAYRLFVEQDVLLAGRAICEAIKNYNEKHPSNPAAPIDFRFLQQGAGFFAGRYRSIIGRNIGYGIASGLQKLFSEYPEANNYIKRVELPFCENAKAEITEVLRDKGFNTDDIFRKNDALSDAPDGMMIATTNAADPFAFAGNEGRASGACSVDAAIALNLSCLGASFSPHHNSKIRALYIRNDNTVKLEGHDSQVSQMLQDAQVLQGSQTFQAAQGFQVFSAAAATLAPAASVSSLAVSTLAAVPATLAPPVPAASAALAAPSEPSATPVIPAPLVASASAGMPVPVFSYSTEIEQQPRSDFEMALRILSVVLVIPAVIFAAIAIFGMDNKRTYWDRLKSWWDDFTSREPINMGRSEGSVEGLVETSTDSVPLTADSTPSIGKKTKPMLKVVGGAPAPTDFSKSKP